MEEQKRLLRASTLAARRGMDDEERVAASARIAERAVSRPDLLMAEVVALYASMADEVDTTAIDTHLRQRRVSCWYPRVDEEILHLVEVGSRDDLSPGHRRILEPDGRSEIESPDVILVPGVAFDLRGGRLGHGGGHYDRLLAAHPGAIRVGLAFSCQLVLRVPMERHDMPLDVVITEHSTHPTGARSGPMEA